MKQSNSMRCSLGYPEFSFENCRLDSLDTHSGSGHGHSIIVYGLAFRTLRVACLGKVFGVVESG